MHLNPQDCLFVFLFVLMLLWFPTYGLKLVLRYKIADGFLTIRYFGIIIMHWEMASIIAVRPPTWKERYNPWILRAGNTLLKPAIVIKRNRGLLRTVIITPDAEFIRTLNAERNLVT